MNQDILGTQISYFIVGKKGEEVFPINIYGFTASRTSDIQSATWYQDSATVVQMASLLTFFAQLNDDTSVFAARQQLIEYSEVEMEE